jgi:hypothetical protein
MSAGWKEGGNTLSAGLLRTAKNLGGGTSQALKVVLQQIPVVRVGLPYNLGTCCFASSPLIKPCYHLLQMAHERV